MEKHILFQYQSLAKFRTNQIQWGARTGCLELDRLFSFSVKRFNLTNICCILMPVNFPLTVLSIKNYFIDITNKLKYLFFNLMKKHS